MEADIPASALMIENLEKLLCNNEPLSRFRSLYQQVKSSIFYSAGLQGKFGGDVNYNIEVLVNTLWELERNELHPLYPFIATWNAKFSSLAGTDFSNVLEFKNEILRQLKNWVQMKYKRKGNYYKGLVELQSAMQIPLRVFSLNYDLCVEGIGNDDFLVETGFGPDENEPAWDWRRFDDGEIERSSPHILLYKMHGSIDWIRDADDRLLSVDYAGENIAPEKMEVIFGRDFKLQASDPFLFYAYEFRRFCLDSKLIVCIGYGFGDEHINKIIGQSLRQDPMRRVLVVRPKPEGDSLAHFQCGVQEYVARQLRVRDISLILVSPMTAKEFLSEPDLLSYLVERFAIPQDAPF